MSRLSAFRSDPADCISYPASGWLCIGNGWLISKLPFWDQKNGLWARLGHGPATELLKGMGGRLPTVLEYDQLKQVALHIEPYTLPTIAMLKAAGVNCGDVKAIDAYRNEHMMTEEWCLLHDEEVFRRLDAAGKNWIGRSVDCVGKHWCDGGLIYGWWLAKGGMIQRASGFHRGDPTYVDYGTNFHGCIQAERP